MTKDIIMKKKLMCNRIIHDLINIAISSCEEREVGAYHKDLRIAAIKSLITLAGVPSKKAYVPGETREQLKTLFFFLSQGGAIVFIILSKMALEEDIKQMAEKEFLGTLEMFEWEKQLEILETFKQFYEQEKSNILTDFPPPKLSKSRNEDHNSSALDISPTKSTLTIEATTTEENKSFEMTQRQDPMINIKPDIAKKINSHHLVFYRTGDFRVKKEKALERMLTLPR